MITSKADDVKKILNLKVGETAHIFWAEEGGGMVECHPTGYILYEIPQYGGEPEFSGSFDLGQEQLMVDIAWTWT